MNPEDWSPKPFSDLLTMPPTPAQRRAYQAQKILSGERSVKNRKLIREWEIFVRFCQAANLEVDPAAVEMLDPNSSTPPPPDLRCAVFGATHYFEIGEIVQEDSVRASAPRTRRLVSEQPLPLTAVWTPLETILNKKLNKRYNSEAKPLSLLLYYQRGSPFWDLLQPLLKERANEVQTAFDQSVFDLMWLFDAKNSNILFSFSRSSMLVVR